MKPVVIFGTGDMARTARYYFEEEGNLEVAAFTVDEAYIDPGLDLGRPVTAFEQILETHPPADFDLFVAMGFSGVNRKRAEVYDKVRQLGYDCVSYVSEHAKVAGNVTVGQNCFVFEFNNVQPFVSIGDNVVLWSGNHIGHDSTIEDHCFIASHVVVSGNVRVGHHSFIGVNATLRDGITIAPHCVIGGHAVLMEDTEEGAVHAVRSTPAIPKKSWELKGL